MDASRARAKLRLMAFDVDGVMTDGSIYYTDAGTELKAFQRPRRRWAQDAGKGRHHRGDHHRASGRLRRTAGAQPRHRTPAPGVPDKVACLQTMLADLGLDARPPATWAMT